MMSASDGMRLVWAMNQMRWQILWQKKGQVLAKWKPLQSQRSS